MGARRIKRAPCTCCLPGGRAIFEQDYDFLDDGSLRPVWTCRNCGHQTARRTPSRRTDRMTPSQKRVIAALREELLRRETLGGRQEVEVKREEVELMEWGEVSMVIEVGGVGDEGTMAEVFCRDRRHVFIGRRGGVRLLNAKDGKKRRGFFAAVNTVTR